MKKIGIVYGGKSAEHEVSLMTAKAVISALDFSTYLVTPIYITLEGEWICGDALQQPVEDAESLRFTGSEQPNSIAQFVQLASHQDTRFDIVFPVLHGPNGEDGTIQGLFEMMNLPYVGNGVLASSAGMDKVVMKQLFHQAGLNQVPYLHCLHSQYEENQTEFLNACEAQLAYPLFVKPANLGSSVGISKAKSREELQQAIQFAFEYDRKIVVEQGIVAREIELSVLGNDTPTVSLAGEVLPTKDFYDYSAKYVDGTTNYAIPAEITEQELHDLQQAAITAFKILDGSGLARADFFLTTNGEVLINEVNTLPGFTPISMYPKLWIASGKTYAELVEELIQLGLERFEEKQHRAYTRDEDGSQ
ncbi:D-alanine--D-alanine ligase [Chryseomicrobium sp. FSL W7-1435]|uniref:D-alanine--D-alanine ligase n=1 Tax=Chryseomicrobium sp. FSL W7-1435 TaxID=2921704 RepID=UPI00315B211F